MIQLHTRIQLYSGFSCFPGREKILGNLLIWRGGTGPSLVMHNAHGVPFISHTV